MYTWLEIDKWGKMTSVWTILWSDEGKQNPENTLVVESKEGLKARWKPEGGFIKLVVTKAADFLVKMQWLERPEVWS